MTTFIFKLKLKNCDKVFKDGFEPGVLVTQEVDFSRHEGIWLTKALFDFEIDFVKNMVEVEVEEKKE